MYGLGISKVGEIVDMGVETDVLQKSGSWFSYEDTKLGQGRETVKELLLDNPELAEEIEKKIKTQLYGTPEPEAEKDDKKEEKKKEQEPATA